MPFEWKKITDAKKKLDNQKKPHKELDRRIREEAEINKKNRLDKLPSFHEALQSPSYVESRDKSDEHQILEPGVQGNTPERSSTYEAVRKWDATIMKVTESYKADQ